VLARRVSRHNGRRAGLLSDTVSCLKTGNSMAAQSGDKNGELVSPFLLEN